MPLTKTDVELAILFYPMLVELAQHGVTDNYENIADTARRLHPDNDYVSRCHHRSVGRRLDVIRREFTEPRHLPVLAALGVNKASKRPGFAFEGDFETLCAQAYAFDWSSVEDAFQEQAEIWKKMIAPRVKRTEKEAIQMMWDYAKVHGTAFDKQVSQCRDDIIALIRQGEEPDDAYELAAGHYRKGN
ncbi:MULTISPECIES: hypothetical protein [Sphingobium]|jgi:hypothetical protein|uniref:hypothetical protein n=1 Tax=Sphingobium TaxID=165695 RepID=UPI000DBADF58|nr:hypothetical protein [Sphingobium sp. YG1]BBD02256.1 hypothetical protein YGS_C2P0269 [Sphingobium sp. YG1]